MSLPSNPAQAVIDAAEADTAPADEPTAVPLRDPETGDPLLDPDTGEQLRGIPDEQPTQFLDPDTGEVLLDADTGEPLSAIPEVAASPTPTPTETATEALTASDDIRESFSERSEAAGNLIERLDGLAIDLGTFHVSLWDVIIVFLVIGGVATGAYLASKLLHSVLKRVTKLDMTRRLLAEKIISLGVWALAFLIGINLLGIDLTALAVFSGAFGLAIGFGLQKTFGNLIAGIILLMDKSIKPGDVIVTADAAGNSVFGQIRKIGVRAVSIITRDQKEYLIPNENLMINQVENWSYSSKNVRIQVPVGVSYNADMKQAEELMLEAAKGCSRVLKTPPPVVWMAGYGESSVDFVIHCWIDDPESGVGNVQSEVLKNLWHLFVEHDVEIPFPQRDINLRSNEAFEQLTAAIAQRINKDG